ncbi:NAD(P)/FAD-dependent oxidoreductase [Silvimonas iriomotensis]|uniref:Pyridine nucleotide-disulfide oxidoreductase n=1 Tax=Silvimonas iriomotensis TaxID=449662 RepID=A0ABQ2PBS1_9NEIS|nr:NAD(P)/FAD-dependent oxidoreductase [Silvimonas iriomotensis]GGP22984.1 pyridine nucleotide-disulfide oxidoreductase [Silvimonas iriomotensis]
MKQRILIIGAGFAGMWSALSAVRLLDMHDRTNVEIALIAPLAELHVRPRLYEQNPEAMKAPLQALFDAVGVRFIQGMVGRIDVEGHQVEVTNAAGETTLQGYDRLVLAAGSRLFRPQIAGLAEHAFNVDQLAEAVRLDEHIKALAQQPSSLARNTVVVAGGGFTGIETAAEMPARLREALGEDTPIRVIMVELNADIGPDLGPGPRPVIEEALGSLGVTWRLSTAVAAVDDHGVTLDNGERIEAATVIWTAGARASALTAQIPAERDAFGRLVVDDNLKVPGVADVYATGDCAHAATDDIGNHAMMSCQHAMALGRSAGNNAVADLLGVTPAAYRQPKYVTCLDLGPWGAVYTEGWDRQVVLRGAEAKSLKQQINSIWIYPPEADRAAALALADPARPVVA